MPKDTGKKLADMLYGQPFDVPTPENLRLGQQMIERELREKAARDAKLTPLDKAKAAYEAAKMMGSAAVAGLGSIPTRIVYGPEAAEKYIANRISIPTTEKGMDYVENVGNFLEQLETKYKLPPILPEAIALQNLTGPATKQATRAAKQKAMQAAKTGERYAERNIPQIMERGGLPADILSGLAEGSLSKMAKSSKDKELALPPVLPRAPAKTKEDIRPYAQRMAQQMTGEFYRPNPKKSENVAGKSFSQFKMEKGLEHDIRPTSEVVEPEVADIEKQLGMLKIGISGDTTIADKILHRAGPYELFDPSPQHGGPRYGLGGEGAWASNNPIASTVQKRINELSEAYGAPPLGQYMAMGPQGSNFAQHFADANLQAIDISAMTKGQIEQINRLIREGSEKSGPRPSFPGIEDKSSAYLHFAIDPELRKHFNDLMQKTSVTEKLNLPDGRIILHAITEPELRDKEILNTGFSQMRLRSAFDPENLEASAHPTYSHVIPHEEGSALTRTKYLVPGELEFSDVLDYAKQHYRPRDMTRVFQTSTPRQIVDPQHIDEMKMYEELMKEYTGKKEGGPVYFSDNPDVMQLELAGGGLVKGLVKAVKGTQEVVPAAEREANLAKMIEQSAVKNRVYHGTESKDDYVRSSKGNDAIKSFAGRATWVAEEPYTAHGYSGKSGYVMPLHVQIKKPLTISHVDANDDASQIYGLAKSLGVDVDHLKSISEPERVWEVINHPYFIDAASNAGFDGISIKEGGLQTHSVFDPSKIKSAIGNRGTYDVTDPDINKAEGGEVHMAGGGEITADDLILEERKL